MRLNVLCAIIIGMVVISTEAATPGRFIDERAAAANPAQATNIAVASPQGSLTGDFALAEWQQQAPHGLDSGSNLSLAIIRLLPLNKPAIEIDAPAELMDITVKWSPGATRYQALTEIAVRNALNINIDGRVVKIRKASPPVRLAAVAPVTVAAAPVNVPVVPSLKKFEVRLTDVKLSTSINRWAAQSGVRVRWDADKHVLISAPMVFSAKNIFEAITQALSTPGIKNSEYPLEVCEYPNLPPLLRITRQGEQVKDCPNI